jgi:hypothetical protein
MLIVNGGLLMSLGGFLMSLLARKKELLIVCVVLCYDIDRVKHLTEGNQRTMYEEKDKARLARAILRVVQRQPNIRRTFLTAQIRAYGEGVFEVLDDLIARGIVIEDAVVARAQAKNRRAVLVYSLAETKDGSEWPSFDDLDALAVGKYLQGMTAAA